jgi:ferredoxin-type protein NapH
MESIKIVQNKAQTNVYNCIICEECVYNCPVKAVSYGKREK